MRSIILGRTVRGATTMASTIHLWATTTVNTTLGRTTRGALTTECTTPTPCSTTGSITLGRAIKSAMMMVRTPPLRATTMVSTIHLRATTTVKTVIQIQRPPRTQRPMMVRYQQPLVLLEASRDDGMTMRGIILGRTARSATTMASIIHPWATTTVNTTPTPCSTMGSITLARPTRGVMVESTDKVANMWGFLCPRIELGGISFVEVSFNLGHIDHSLSVEFHMKSGVDDKALLLVEVDD